MQNEHYKLIGSGKVREIYQQNPREIVMVATDRVSAFDKKLGIGIPDKGKLLTSISAFWSVLLEDEGFVMTAYLSSNAIGPRTLSPFGPFTESKFDTPEFAGRATKMTKLNMFPVECIVRGHICGSAWKLYEKGTREICGVKLPDGLRNGDKLPEPIFTPTTKAPEGEHDENITLEEMADVLSQHNAGCHHTATQIRDLCLRAYNFAYQYALNHGLILADTKFELGFDRHQNIVFGDEILTPDSSRYWDAAKFVPGQEQQSFDKQIIRDYLAKAKERGEETPVIPAKVLEQTSAQYAALFERLVGESWPKS